MINFNFAPRPPQDLQSVTDIGNGTTNNMTVGGTPSGPSTTIDAQYIGFVQTPVDILSLQRGNDVFGNPAILTGAFQPDTLNVQTNFSPPPPANSTREIALQIGKPFLDTITNLPFLALQAPAYNGAFRVPISAATAARFSINRIYPNAYPDSTGGVLYAGFIDLPGANLFPKVGQVFTPTIAMPIGSRWFDLGSPYANRKVDVVYTDGTKTITAVIQN